MAERTGGKVKQAGADVAKRQKALKQKMPASPVKAVSHAALAEENVRLKAELEHAMQRIEELERQRSAAIDRIDWVIDALRHIVEPSA